MIEPLFAHPYLARPRAFESGNDSQQGRFPGTALAQNRQKFSLSNLQRNILQDQLAPESLGYIAITLSRIGSGPS